MQYNVLDKKQLGLNALLNDTSVVVSREGQVLPFTFPAGPGD